jgi:hypothetical protein
MMAAIEPVETIISLAQEYIGIDGGLEISCSTASAVPELAS